MAILQASNLTASITKVGLSRAAKYSAMTLGMPAAPKTFSGNLIDKKKLLSSPSSIKWRQAVQDELVIIRQDLKSASETIAAQRGIIEALLTELTITKTKTVNTEESLAGLLLALTA